VRARRMRWPLLRVAVAERSMEPGLRDGDWLLALRTRRIRPGRVVLALHPERPDFLLVKRAAWREERDGGAAGGWWLASDNPAAGAVDSARFGLVPADKIVAVVLLRYWPLRRSASAVLSRRGSSLTERAARPGKRSAPPPGCRGAGRCVVRRLP
jgi:hypothetical protein